MAENTWLKCEREYFAKKDSDVLGVTEKMVNKIIERYNRFLQKVLLGESPFVAEDLKITMLKSEGENANGKL